MKKFFWLLVCAVQGATPGGPFLVKPYLQFGTRPDPASLTLLWQTDSDAGDWAISWKSNTIKPTMRPLALGAKHYSIYQGVLNGLKAGEAFTYHVTLGGKQVFEAPAHASAAADAAYKFAVFGDCGADTAGQRKVAVEVHQFKPDFVFIPGDIVYWFGDEHGYLQKFFPIYNADTSDNRSGAPLMRSTVFAASLGNHDIAGRDLGSHPDGLAYFYNWSLPLNGLPTYTFAGYKGSAGQTQALNNASGGAFPRMANYSFTYGNSYWLILDSNPDTDWSQPDAAQWVEGELASAAAKDAKWRFVGFHHPGFNSSHAHAGDQQMRVLSKSFEAGKVDVVFSGHVHNYQRTYPMQFKLGATKNRRATGEWTLDNEFDGKTKTKPAGVIYIITGAGGAFLYDKGQGSNRKSWQEFTTQFVSDVHSFTAVEINGSKAAFRQLDEQGRVVDSFSITK